MGITIKKASMKVFSSDQEIFDHFTKDYPELTELMNQANKDQTIEDTQDKVKKITSRIGQSYGTVYQKAEDDGRIVQSFTYSSLWNIIEPSVVVANIRNLSSYADNYTDTQINNLYQTLKKDNLSTDTPTKQINQTIQIIHALNME